MVLSKAATHGQMLPRLFLQQSSSSMCTMMAWLPLRLCHAFFEGGQPESRTSSGSNSESGLLLSLRVLQQQLLLSSNSLKGGEACEQGLESLGEWLLGVHGLSQELNPPAVPLGSDWPSSSSSIWMVLEVVSTTQDMVAPSKLQGCAMSLAALVSNVCLLMCNVDAILGLPYSAVILSPDISSFL